MANTAPSLSLGQVPSVTSWQGFFSVKVDETNGNIVSPTINGTVSGTPTWSGLQTFSGGAKITGGSSTIDGTVIGGTTASAGSFTTLSASGSVNGAGFISFLASPPPIGGTAAAAGTFTTVSATKYSSATLASSSSYANDAAAATGGVAIGDLYRNGNFVMIRLT